MAALLAIAALLAELGRYWWVADLFAHLRFHYLTLGASLLAVAALCRMVLVAAALGLASLAHAWSLFAYATAPVVELPPENPVSKIRVVTASLLYQDRRRPAAFELFRKSEAEIICIQEAHIGWQHLLKRLEDLYPYQRGGRFAREAILSRYPIESYGLHYPADTLGKAVAQDLEYRSVLKEINSLPRQPRYRYLLAHIRTPVGLISVLCTHPPAPLSSDLAILHRGYFAAYQIEAKYRQAPLLIAGDFNITPYSPRLRDLLRRSGLRAVDHGKFWPQTWPADGAHSRPFRYLPGFPIDHVLVSREFRVLSIRRGPGIRSDHYPVTVDLLLKTVQ